MKDCEKSVARIIVRYIARIRSKARIISHLRINLVSILSREQDYTWRLNIVSNNSYNALFTLYSALHVTIEREPVKAVTWSMVYLIMTMAR